jgi:hypothetical protein
MMESAEDGLCNDVTKAVDRTRKRRVLSQSEMRPDLVVIGSISLENLTQMGLAKDDDVESVRITAGWNLAIGLIVSAMVRGPLSYTISGSHPETRLFHVESCSTLEAAEDRAMDLRRAGYENVTVTSLLPRVRGTWPQ